jgi:hypothetical protein
MAAKYNRTHSKKWSGEGPKMNTAAIDEAFQLVNQAINAAYMELEKAFPPGSRVICFYHRAQKNPAHGEVISVDVDGRVTVKLESGHTKRIHYKTVALEPKVK